MPLVNPISKATVTTHTQRMFLQAEETIKTNHLAKQPSLAFTQDTWTAPNVTAMMAVTAHYTDEDFILRDLTNAVPHITGLSSIIHSFNKSTQ